MPYFGATAGPASTHLLRGTSLGGSGVTYATGAAFVSSSSSALGSSGTSLSVPAPANQAATNLLVAYIYSEFPAETITAPTGWTLAGSTAPAQGQGLVYTLALTGSSGGPYVWSGTSTGFKTAVIDQYSGTAGLDGTPAFGAGSTNSMIAPTVTPTKTGDTWLVFYAFDTNSHTFGTPTGMTQRGGTGVVAGAPESVSFDKTLTASSATGTATSGLSGIDAWVAASVLLK